MLSRLCFPVLLLVLPLFMFGNEALRSQLDLYVGRWVGSFTVTAPDIDYEETFRVEQRYWWQDSELRGISVMRRSTGIESSTTTNVIDGDKIISEVKRGEDTQIFYGAIVEGGLLWFPAQLARANDYQIKEAFNQVDGEWILSTSGFDTFLNKGEPSLLIYKGELLKVQ